MSREKFAEAIQLFDRILLSNPSNVESLTGRGFSTAKMGRLEGFGPSDVSFHLTEAQSYFLKAVQIDPAAHEALTYAGLVFKDRDKLADAVPPSPALFDDQIAFYERALQADPSSKLAKESLAVALADMATRLKASGKVDQGDPPPPRTHSRSGGALPPGHRRSAELCPRALQPWRRVIAPQISCLNIL